MTREACFLSPRIKLWHQLLGVGPISLEPAGGKLDRSPELFAITRRYVQASLAGYRALNPGNLIGAMHKVEMRPRS